MKIYLSHAGNYDYEKELYAPLKASPLASRHDIFYPHEVKNVAVNTRELLPQYDLVLAEVSHPSTGQGIEIGRAEAAGVPVLCIYHEGAQLSRSLRFVTQDFIAYTSTPDLLQQLEERLK